MNESTRKSAIEYGQALMAQVSGRDCGTEQTPQQWQNWTRLLFETEDLIQAQIYSVWSQVTMAGAGPTEVAYVPLVPVSLHSRIQSDQPAWELYPSRTASDYGVGVARLAEAFLANGGATEQGFDRFYSLMQKYASALPCTYGEDGVSLFRQWCMVSAVMALSSDGTASGLPESIGLVGIDLPGIQETVYTIASRGAGKSVRGRSAFVQLLVNALVDRLIRDLGLTRANVIVNAGGNALLLCRWTAELESELESFGMAINNLLFAGIDGSTFPGFSGDLSLAVACQEAPWDVLAYPIRHRTDDGEPVSAWQYYEKLLKYRLTAAKQQPFIGLLNTPESLQWFFRPDPILSNRYCAVCRRPENPAAGDFAPLHEEETDGEARREAAICPLCDSFRILADSLARNAGYLNCHATERLPDNAAVWQVALHAVSSGLLYSFVGSPAATGRNMALSPDGFPGVNVEGYWPMARTTPMHDHMIRDNESLADVSPGTFKRLGILKADVDDLGAMLVGGLRDQRSAALTATMSEALTLFFGGWLDRICAEEPYDNLVYVLYAGGDDLLIVGSWHVMPQLAARIAGDFERFTGNNPGVHLSAGIHVVGGKEPLYAAIEGADEALKEAKRFDPHGKRTKRALGVFGMVFSWDQFAKVSEWETKLKQMVLDGASSAVLVTLQELFAQYEDDRLPRTESRSGYAVGGQVGRYAENDKEILLGPWLWQMIYRLHRIAGQNVELKGEIEELQRQLLTPDGIRQLAVSARWAQLLSREKS